MLWPQAMAGVVRPARVPTTPRGLAPALPLLVQGGEFFLALMSLCIETTKHTKWHETAANAPYACGIGVVSEQL